MTHPLTVVTRHLPTQFYSETLKRPWMRLHCFLDGGPLSRAPEHYKKFFYEWKIKLPKPVHYIPEEGKYTKLEDGRIVPVCNYPIKLVEPYELHKGLWGGEGVIRGFVKRKKLRRRVPHYWVPLLQNTVVYSEILDRYMKMTVTERALNLIDEHHGLDYYILQSEPADLMSGIGLKLKREMYLSLFHKDLYPDDVEKKEEIYEKYKEYIIPYEEADWYGLNLKDAYLKQRNIEKKEAILGPYKHIFRKELVDFLIDDKTEKKTQSDQIQEEEPVGKLSGLLSKIGFNKKKGSSE